MANDTTWHTLLTTWRPHFFGLYLDGNLVASSTAANTATSTAWSIFRFGWGFFDQPGLQWRHRSDRVLRRVLDPGHDPPVARRSVRLSAPMERGACAHGERVTLNASLERHRRGHLPDGVVSNDLSTGTLGSWCSIRHWWSANPPGMLWPP
jgi:hypothetical protein